MTTRGRPRGGSRRRTSRRVTTWENLIFSIPLAVGINQVVSDITPEPMSADVVGTATIVRSLIKVTHNLTFESGNPQEVGLGITVMTNDGFFALAPPDPLSDFQQDWYWWTFMSNMKETFSSEASYQEVFDIRSARRLRGGFKLVLVTETSVGGHPVASELRVSMRNLWQVTS